jgi:lipopolysaccharide export system permease protein
VHIKLTHEGYFFVRAFDKFDYIGFGAHIERVEGKTLQERLVAEEVQWMPEKRRWRFLRVWRFLGGSPPTYLPAVDTLLPLTPEDIIRSELYTRTMNLPELWAEYQRQRYVGGDISALLEMELHERAAIPLASVILTALGFASASRKRRGGVAWQIGLGLVLAFIYVFLLAIGKNLFSTSAGWAWIGVWMPNALFSAIALIWLLKAPK